MKKKIAVFLAAVLFSFSMILSSPGHAVKRAELWENMCESCHDGKTAPDAEWMRDHFGSVDEFVDAIKSRGNRCMNILKHDETLARKIALEIGIRDGKGK